MPAFPSPRVSILGAMLALAGLLTMRPVVAQQPPPRERLHRADVEALAAGALLVSARRLPDSNFSRTVVLLADVNEKGALGLVVNRRSDLPLARVFPNLKVTAASTERAFLGGPVETTRVMALVRGIDTPANARTIGSGISLISGESLEAVMTAGPASSRVRVYLGYAGWGPGQLEAETEEGAWRVVAGDADIVFDPDPAGLWQRQIARTEVIQARREKPATVLLARR